MDEAPARYLPTDDRKRAIAAAARALIVEKGFEGLRTREIADRVGINIATLHYHIPTKDALIELVARSMREEFQQQHLNQPRDGLSPEAMLLLEIEQFRTNRRDNPQLIAVMEEMSRRARFDANIARHIMPMRAVWLEHITRILAAGIADGTFRGDLEPVAGAYLVIGALISASSFHLDEAGFDRVVAELLRCLQSNPAKGKSDD